MITKLIIITGLIMAICLINHLFNNKKLIWSGKMESSFAEPCSTDEEEEEESYEEDEEFLSVDKSERAEEEEETTTISQEEE